MNTASAEQPILKSGHLLGIEDLSVEEIVGLLDLADQYVDLNRGAEKKSALLKGRTLINLFFEASTRTQSSFELAGKRMGADVLNMSVKTSSVSKGETLIDTATTLNAMRPDIIVVRHQDSGAAELLSQKLDCSLVNAGTIRRRGRKFQGLVVAICGDVAHSRVARSNIHLLSKMGARVRLVAPRTLLPVDAARFGVEIFSNMKEGLKDADIVMMLRLQLERMSGAFVPSTREYFRFWGLDRAKLAFAKKGALVMHPGPMNRGVEIDSAVADDIEVSLIHEQVEMGVAIRMAVLDALARGFARERRNVP